MWESCHLEAVSEEKQLKPLGSQPAGHPGSTNMRLAQGKQTRSLELSSHFTKTWVSKVNLSGCRERRSVIKRLQGLSYDKRLDEQAFAASAQQRLEWHSYTLLLGRRKHSGGRKIFMLKHNTDTEQMGINQSFINIGWQHPLEVINSARSLPSSGNSEIQSYIPKLQYRRILYLFSYPQAIYIFFSWNNEMPKPFH